MRCFNHSQSPGTIATVAHRDALLGALIGPALPTLIPVMPSWTVRACLVTKGPRPLHPAPPGRSYSSGLACCPVVPLGFWVEEERDDAVNEDAVSSYRKQAGRYAEAAGYEACLADVVGRAIGQHVGERC